MNQDSREPITGNARPRVESYLDKLRRGLTGLSPEDAREIVEEIRSHILEKASSAGVLTAASVEPVLAALGDPSDLAARYMTDNLLTRAARSRSPLLLLRGLLRWASLSAAGFFVFLGCLVGYFIGASFVACAILKPLHPRTAGLWSFPDGAYSLAMGFAHQPPVGGTELLGWWMVPLGLLIGGGLCLLTTLFARWCARQFRKWSGMQTA